MPKVNVLQVCISTSDIFGVGLIWIGLGGQILRDVLILAAASLQKPAAAPLPDEEDLCEAASD